MFYQSFFTSPCPDNIPPVILKTAAHSLVYPLSIVFNRSYSTGILPKDWLQTAIILMYKRLGSRLVADNYRLVALRSVVCKLMESIIKIISRLT